MGIVRAGIGRILAVICVAALSAASSPEKAEGQLRWQMPQKEEIRVRLVALALALPRSSFFSSHEVFVAEKQLSHEEFRLIKLVYEFLPYQPRLSDYGLNYSLIHEIRAIRDPSCDETLLEMTARLDGAGRPDPHRLHWSFRYSTDSPGLNLERRKSTLPCYQTTADDYNQAQREPSLIEP